MKIAINVSALDYGDVNFSEFESLGEVTYFGEVKTEELYSIASDCDALIINKIAVDENLLNACPNIKYIGLFSTGYNLVDLAACKKHGVTVCNAPDYSTNSVSQHTFALLLAFYGAINEYASSVANGGWVNSKTFSYYLSPMHELNGKTFGIFGYGNIGKAVAKIAAAFGAEVVVCTRSKHKDCPYKVTDFETLLKTSDVLSLHCPLTDATAKIINADALSKMKKNSVIINTARGGLIDEKALADALNGGKIAGACLDTVSEEPMKKDNPLLNAKNCLITPHVAWMPKETRQRLIGTASANLKAYINGNPVNTVE
ncbi:MAG: D-2-hydroxyacid dehydrogenase [Clostridia bacterium]|nr:D-2-hydroxyacid dehydrogenase [Clostridia bacterium]